MALYLISLDDKVQLVSLIPIHNHDGKPGILAIQKVPFVSLS